MKRKTQIALAAGVAAVIGTIAFAGAVSARDGGPDRWRGQHGAFMRGGGMDRGFAMMEQFDLDKDGNLTQEEIDRVRQDRLAKFDADKDGKLSLQEFQPLWLDFTRQQMVRAFQRLDGDGDAALTLEEYQRPTRRMVMRADRNNDGRLNSEDLRRGRAAAQDGPRRDSR